MAISFDINILLIIYYSSSFSVLSQSPIYSLILAFILFIISVTCFIWKTYLNVHVCMTDQYNILSSCVFCLCRPFPKSNDCLITYAYDVFDIEIYNLEKNLITIYRKGK